MQLLSGMHAIKINQKDLLCSLCSSFFLKIIDLIVDLWRHLIILLDIYSPRYLPAGIERAHILLTVMRLQVGALAVTHSYVALCCIMQQPISCVMGTWRVSRFNTNYSITYEWDIEFHFSWLTMIVVQQVKGRYNIKSQGLKC